MTTKTCPKCNTDKVASFPSLNKRYCCDCVYWWDWVLKPGQDSLIKSTRLIK